MESDVDVAVIGGGAAGVAAAKRLQQAKLRCLLVEARPRLGGRALTVHDAAGHALDVGCGWLHSADRNPWVGVAQSEGLTVDKTSPPWTSRPLERSFPPAELADYRKAFDEFYDRLHDAAEREGDAPASSLLDPASRWNALLNATSTYISGATLDRISLKDLARYHATDVNWRVVEGYGTLISKHGASLPQILGCPVNTIDHSGKRLRIETAKGVIAADQVIVTVPTSLLAAERIAFTPALPQKVEAARGLPLGVDDKLFVALDRAEEFDVSVRVYGRTDRVGTAGYHLRPFGWPIIECYFGGDCAAELEKGGLPAFFDFAVSELTGVFGNDFAGRLAPIRVHGWASDPFALGAYSYAVPGKAECRAALAAPVDNRLFFAGEACSPHDFSTAHGGYLTGVAAAEQVIASRNISR